MRRSQDLSFQGPRLVKYNANYADLKYLLFPYFNEQINYNLTRRTVIFIFIRKARNKLYLINIHI